jgi:hypothetical protein
MALIVEPIVVLQRRIGNGRQRRAPTRWLRSGACPPLADLYHGPSTSATSPAGLGASTGLAAVRAAAVLPPELHLNYMAPGNPSPTHPTAPLGYINDTTYAALVIRRYGRPGHRGYGTGSSSVLGWRSQGPARAQTQSTGSLTWGGDWGAAAAGWTPSGRDPPAGSGDAKNPCPSGIWSSAALRVSWAAVSRFGGCGDWSSDTWAAPC